jgi:hypothetical protein
VRRSYEAGTIPKRAAHAVDTLGRWTFIRFKPARSPSRRASAKGLEPGVADSSTCCSIVGGQNRFLPGYGPSASAAAGRSRRRGSGSARSTARAVPRCGRCARSRPRRSSPGAPGEPAHPVGSLAVNEASDLDAVSRANASERTAYPSCRTPCRLFGGRRHRDHRRGSVEVLPPTVPPSAAL